MEFRPLRIAGSYEIVFEPRRDDRGCFMRVYDEAEFQKRGLVTRWAQEAHAWNARRGTLRGLHFQQPPHPETKQVQVVSGAIYDLLLDLRKSSPTFGQWEAVELRAGDGKALYVPAGCAQGYQTIEDNTLIAYRISAPYHPDLQAGVRWNDPSLAIPWPIHNPQVAPKDNQWPLWREFVTPFE
jgi:dTDP-4-dehydrorhamnose 3,5-epimerase